MPRESTLEKLRRERKRAFTLARTARRYGIDTEAFQPKENWFFRVLEKLERPQMAVFNVVDGIQHGDEPQDLLASAWRGLSGDEKTYFSDILKNAGMADGTSLVVTGFVGDVILDPLNVIPLGLFSKMSKGARIRLLSSARGRTAALWMDEALRTKGLDTPRRMFHRMFIKSADVDQEMGRRWVRSVEKEWQELSEADAIATIGEGRHIEVVAKGGEFEKAARSMGLSPAELQAKILEIPEKHRILKYSEHIVSQAELAGGVQFRMRMLDEVLSAPVREGRLPHHALGRIVYKMAQDSRYSQEVMMSGYIRELRTFYRDGLKHLSEADQRRVTLYAEYLGMRGATPEGRQLKQTQLQRILAGADNSDGVAAAGRKMRDMEDFRFDMEDKLGIRTRVLGGVFDKQKIRYLASARHALKNLEENTRRAYRTKRIEPTIRELKTLADELDSWNFGSKATNQDRNALTTLMRTAAEDPNGPTIEDVRNIRNYLEGFMEKADPSLHKPLTAEEVVRVTGKLESSKGNYREFVKAKSAARKLVKGLERRPQLGEISTAIRHRLSAHEKFLTEVLPKSINHRRERIISVTRDRMRKIAELRDKVPGYVLDYVDEETAEALALAGGKVRQGLYSEKHGSMIHRKWVDGDGVPLPREEIEKIARMTDKQLEEYGVSFLRRQKTLWEFVRRKPDRMGSYFEADPAALMLLRGQRGIRAISAKQFNESMGKLFGSYAGPDAREMAQLGFRTLRQVSEETGAVRYARVAAQVAPDVKRAIDQIRPAYISPDASKEFIRHYDALLNMWKGTTLFPWPAYHVRNFVGNLWNMALGGFFSLGDVDRIGFWHLTPDPQAYLDFFRAAKMQRHLTSGNTMALKGMKFNFNGTNMDGAELLYLARRHNVIDRGMSTDNYQRAIEHEIKAAGGMFDEAGDFSYKAAREAWEDMNPLNPLNWMTPGRLGRNPLMRFGQATARAIENQARMAFFMKRLRMGDDAAEAAAKTAKYLIDYTDLTPFEAQWARRLMPFYTWTRKNIPLQLEGLLNRPQQFALIPKATRAAAAPESPLQPVFQLVSGAKEGRGITPEEYPVPMEIPDWMRKVAPVPLRRDADGKLEFAILGGWLPAADLDRVAPENLWRTGIDMIAPGVKLPFEMAMRRNFFMDRSLKGTSELFGVRMDARLAHALTTLRAINEADRLMAFRGFSFSSRRLRPETDESFLQRVFRWATGIKVYPTDTRRARLHNMREINNLMSIEVAKDRRARSRRGRAEVQKALEQYGGKRWW